MVRRRSFHHRSSSKYIYFRVQEQCGPYISPSCRRCLVFGHCAHQHVSILTSCIILPTDHPPIRLYHFNPWTDTAEGACSSFDLYRKDPVNFFMYRFTGMTRPVAEHLANKVFCILENPDDDSPRTTAHEFGTWSRNLVTLLSGHGMHRTLSSSSQGHPIAASTLLSHRPSSRPPSTSTMAVRTPALTTRSLSRAPSLGPAYEGREHSDLSTVFDHEPEEEEEEHGILESQASMDIRSTSTGKRRKRGARKGRGATSPDSKDETLATLANASQSLAREISKASRSSSAHRSVSKPSSKRAYEPFEPPSLFPIPTPLLTVPRSGNPRTQPLPPISQTLVAKKPSKWKLGFGKNNAAIPAGRVSPVEEATSFDGASAPMSTTASHVTSLIMGLDASVANPTPVPSDAGSLTWGRGRRNRGTNAPLNGSSRSLALVSSESSAGRWDYPERRSERGISPNSTRNARPVASSASSIVSSNWRSSMSTTSSPGTSTSAFTSYSNSSARSISTAATSVSSSSWRTNVKPASVNSKTGYAALPRNIKGELRVFQMQTLADPCSSVMDGVPWELHELPRGQHANRVIFGSPPPPPPRKQRTRKPKDVTLDTINERPAAGAPKVVESQRRDASTSTTDLDGLGSDGEGVKKVQKGQINALAKMLSALRR